MRTGPQRSDKLKCSSWLKPASPEAINRISERGFPCVAVLSKYLQPGSDIQSKVMYKIQHNGSKGSKDWESRTVISNCQSWTDWKDKIQIPDYFLLSCGVMPPHRWPPWTESWILNNEPQWNNKHAVLTSFPLSKNVNSRWLAACGKTSMQREKMDRGREKRTKKSFRGGKGRRIEHCDSHSLHLQS